MPTATALTAHVEVRVTPDRMLHPARDWASSDERDAWFWFHDCPDQAPTTDEGRLAWLLMRWKTDPVLYAIECLRVVPLPYQAEILLNLANAPREVFEFYGFDPTRAKEQALASSGHGVGKTRTEAIAIMWHKDTHRFSKTLVTAPTADQITGQLWGEIGKLHRRQRDRWPLIANEWNILGQSIRHKNEDYADWYVIGRTARAEAPEGLQGAHGQDADDEFGELAALFQEEAETGASGGMLVVIEEASGVVNEIREVLDGALSEPNSRLLAMGNATRPDGWFADDLGRLDRYAVFEIDCRNSDSTKIYAIPYRDFSGAVRTLHARGRVQPKYWADMLVECSGDEDHDRFRVRVRGQKPRSAFEQIIRTHWVEQAEARAEDEASKHDDMVIGLDFGLTSDKHGKAVRQGFNCLDVVEWLPKEKPEEITMDAAQRAIDDVELYRPHVRTIVGDANGVGRGAMEYLWDYFHHKHPEYNVRVIFFNSGAKANDDSRYYLQRDELWHKRGRAWLANPRTHLPKVPGLKAQLTAPGAHEDDRRKIWVESKADVKKRSGQDSGNGADALLQTLLVDTAPVHEKPKAEPGAFAKPFVEAFERIRALADLENGLYIRRCALAWTRLRTRAVVL